MSEAKVFTGNNTSETKKPQQTARKGARGDNPIPTQLTILNLIQMHQMLLIVQDKYAMRYVEALTLCYIYWNYATTGKGMSCPMIWDCYYRRKGGMQPIQERLTMFRSKGLIEVFGANTARNISYLYIPTQSVVNYLSRLRVIIGE